MDLMKESPVTARLRELPRGNGNWRGALEVWQNLQKVAEYLAQGKYTYLAQDHVETMAVLGCGHEETMKGWLLVCRQNGWLK